MPLKLVVRPLGDPYDIWAHIKWAWTRNMDEGKTNYTFTINFVWKIGYFVVMFYSTP